MLLTNDSVYFSQIFLSISMIKEKLEIICSGFMCLSAVWGVAIAMVDEFITNYLLFQTMVCY